MTKMSKNTDTQKAVEIVQSEGETRAATMASPRAFEAKVA